jgi:hypothetical protein
MFTKDLVKYQAYAYSSGSVAPTMVDRPGHWNPDWNKCVILDTVNYTDMNGVPVKGRPKNKHYWAAYGIPAMIQTPWGDWAPVYLNPGHIAVPWDVFKPFLDERIQAKERAVAEREAVAERKREAVRSLNEALQEMNATGGLPGIPDWQPAVKESWSYGVDINTVEGVEWLAALIRVSAEAAEVYKDYLYDLED